MEIRELKLPNAFRKQIMDHIYCRWNWGKKLTKEGCTENVTETYLTLTFGLFLFFFLLCKYAVLSLSMQMERTEKLINE